MAHQRILFLSVALPARSETFVYREIFALRSLGLDILTASVHKPEYGLGSPELDYMAESAIPVYGAGMLRLFIHAAKEIVASPAASISTLFLAVADAFRASDISALKRVKVLWHGVAALVLAQRVRREAVIHIHAHMAHVPTTIAMYAAKQLGVTFSFTGHANDLFPNRALLSEKTRRALFVVCISRWHRAFYQSVYPRSEASLPIIRCGVDTRRVEYAPVRNQSVLRVLSVGRLVQKKGFDTLIRAVAVIAEKGEVQLSVTIAGSGPEQNNLSRMVSELPPGAKVELIGQIDNERVVQLMGQYDLFVLPMRITGDGDRDGIPVVLMEAMAKGRCVVVGDLVTVRELVDDYHSGILIPMDDASTLSHVLEMLATNRSLIETIGLAARTKIESEFDTTKNAQLLLKTMRSHDLMV